MTILLIVLTLVLFTSPLSAGEVKPLYQLPDKTTITNSTESENGTDLFIVGSDSGLYKITNCNSAIPLWENGRVDQILRLSLPDSEGNTVPSWVLRTSKGIIFTQDLKNFEERNEGLPFLTVKKYKDNQKTLEKQIQSLKDICANPVNPLELVTATKDNVYRTKDGGKTWKSIGSMSRSTPGIKAVAVATLGGESVVFMSHPIFGLSYIYPDRANPVWIDVAAGFEKMPSLTSPDEIADILPVERTGVDGTKKIQIYCTQTFLPRIYTFNWETKKGELLYKDTEPLNTYDGLTLIDNVLLYTKLESFGSLDLDTLQSPGLPSQLPQWQKAFSGVPGMVNSAWIPQSKSGFGRGILLNELYLLYPGTINTPYAEKANGKKSIYASAYQCSFKSGQEKFKKVIKDRNLNSIVIDMKDDYGLLRYDSHDPAVLAKAKTSMYAVELDPFIEEFKKENIYMIARIVTFKDRSLSRYANGKYAVWDYKLNKPWVGIKGHEDILDEEGNPTGNQEETYYDENWVDPYSEEVWEYNIQIAKELIARGFDEIQFDYIRFPTDGYNLANAQYRWRDKGMDKESALISFLSYARENIDAPIGIDIYGANGWYRSGTRTGQDAEMLAEYVDVIGPMFYPSHFEQSFLNYAPAADRTYRVYYYGSYRNTIMCHNKAIIRPWVQSFYLNVSYDRKYYDSDYIKKEIFGVRDSIDRGYMCWNNSGDYSTTPADVTATEPYIGTAPEAGPEFQKPAIGSAMKPLFTNETDLSILDSILYQYNDKRETNTKKTEFAPLLQIPFINIRRE